MRWHKLHKNKYIAAIGAANIDLIGHTTDPLIMKDSNPGKIHICPGGVARNISENLARLSTDVRMISSLGDDVFGQKIIDFSEKAGINMHHCYISKSGDTSSYLAILENDGEMALALSDMTIIGQMPKEHITQNQQMIENSELIVLDTCLSESMITHILDSFPNKPVIIDPTSIGKAKRMKNLIGRFDTIKMNQMEAEFLSNLQIKNEDDLQKAGDFFMQQGTKRVFITLGGAGVFYQTPAKRGIFATSYITPINVSGAGDAFTAGVAYCTIHDKDIEYTSKFASAMSRITLKSLSTVSPEISLSQVLAEMQGAQCALATPKDKET
jgi:pseudouridine kinase